MQKFSAFDLYELGIQGWGYGGSDSNPEILAAWENGLVTELHAGFGMGDLSWNLLDLVLPIVCEPVIDAFTNFYVSAPNAGWKDVLKNCHDFIVNKREWTPFGRYQMQISDKLMMAGGGGPRCLNAIYRDVVAARFDNHELEQLTSGLYTLAIHEKRLPAPLTSSQLQLVRRAQEYFGELQIGTRQHMFRLSEFNLVADTTTM